MLGFFFGRTLDKDWLGDYYVMDIIDFSFPVDIHAVSKFRQLHII